MESLLLANSPTQPIFKSYRIPVRLRTRPTCLYSIVIGQYALFLRSSFIFLQSVSDPSPKHPQTTQQIIVKQPAHSRQHARNWGDRDKGEAVNVLRGAPNLVVKANV